jgi:hypothetical protein
MGIRLVAGYRGSSDIGVFNGSNKTPHLIISGAQIEDLDKRKIAEYLHGADWTDRTAKGYVIPHLKPDEFMKDDIQEGTIDNSSNVKFGKELGPFTTKAILDLAGGKLMDGGPSATFMTFRQKDNGKVYHAVYKRPEDTRGEVEKYLSKAPDGWYIREVLNEMTTSGDIADITVPLGMEVPKHPKKTNKKQKQDDEDEKEKTTMAESNWQDNVKPSGGSKWLDKRDIKSKSRMGKEAKPKDCECSNYPGFTCRACLNQTAERNKRDKESFLKDVAESIGVDPSFVMESSFWKAGYNPSSDSPLSSPGERSNDKPSLQSIWDRSQAVGTMRGQLVGGKAGMNRQDAFIRNAAKAGYTDKEISRFLNQMS